MSESVPWVPKSADHIAAPSAEIRRMDWPEAQQWCNFVLMKPDLPQGWRIERPRMRPEAPPGRKVEDEAGRSVWTLSNRSCHRMDVSTSQGRLRVKQFLYDWAPPAFDHPSLWLSETRPFEVRDNVGWLGNDYRKLPAASLHLDRTMIEVSVIEGVAHESELTDFCRSLTPVSSRARSRILATCFGDLSYQRRHPDADVIAVPVGYWAHKRTPPDVATRVICRDEIDPGLPGIRIRPPESFGYRLDTAFVFGESETPQEVEFIYERSENAGHYIRILVWPQGAPSRLAYPPELDRQPCSSHLLLAAGRNVYYAYRHENYGPHEAVWSQHDVIVMLLVKPLPWTDRDWFFELLGEMVETEPAQPQ